MAPGWWRGSDSAPWEGPRTSARSLTGATDHGAVLRKLDGLPVVEDVPRVPMALRVLQAVVVALVVEPGVGGVPVGGDAQVGVGVVHVSAIRDTVVQRVA